MSRLDHIYRHPGWRLLGNPNATLYNPYTQVLNLLLPAHGCRKEHLVNYIASIVLRLRDAPEAFFAGVSAGPDRPTYGRCKRAMFSFGMKVKKDWKFKIPPISDCLLATGCLGCYMIMHRC